MRRAPCIAVSILNQQFTPELYALELRQTVPRREPPTCARPGEQMLEHGSRTLTAAQEQEGGGGGGGGGGAAATAAQLLAWARIFAHSGAESRCSFVTRLAKISSTLNQQTTIL
jgi:hypothetical protein